MSSDLLMQAVQGDADSDSECNTDVVHNSTGADDDADSVEQHSENGSRGSSSLARRVDEPREQKVGRCRGPHRVTRQRRRKSEAWPVDESPVGPHRPEESVLTAQRQQEKPLVLGGSPGAYREEENKVLITPLKKKRRLEALSPDVVKQKKSTILAKPHEGADQMLQCIFEGHTCVPVWPQYDLPGNKDPYVKVAPKEAWFVAFAGLRR